MSSEHLSKKNQTSVIDFNGEVGLLQIKEGSILEHIPTYNDLFNKGKSEVFPLQSLEQTVSDN